MKLDVAGQPAATAEDETAPPKIQVSELFGPTIQGEGLDVGRPCFFIRLHHCPVKCPGCFIGKTLIRMADYSTKPISKIMPGDYVLSYSRKSGSFVPRRVVRVTIRLTKELYRLHTGSKDKFTYVTGEHPVLVRDRGWVEVKDLHVGDHIVHLSPTEMMCLHNPMKSARSVKKMKATTLANGGGKGPLEYMSEEEKKDLRERNSVRMIENNPMKDPDVAVKAFRNRHDRGRMTGPEKFVESVTKDLGLSFVGDGKLAVAGAIPDFIIEGTNKLVEVWDVSQTERMYRDEEWQKRRQDRFAAEGYEVLFLPVKPFGREDRAGSRKITIRREREREVARVRLAVAEFKHNGKIVTGLEKVTPHTRPKVWARIAGDLETPVSVHNFEVEGTHTYVANSMVVHNCDTFYTWDGSEAGESRTLKDLDKWVTDRLDEFPKCGLVLTGGEPLVHYQNKSFTELLYRWRNWKPTSWLSLETSGFISRYNIGRGRPTQAARREGLLKEFLGAFTTVHCSPKVTPCLHGAGWTDEELTSNVGLVLKNSPFVALKFVAAGEEDVKAARRCEEALMPWGRTVPVYLMPYGTEREEILNTCERLLPMAARYGYVITPRLHSLLWGKERMR